MNPATRGRQNSITILLSTQHLLGHIHKVAYYVESWYKLWRTRQLTAPMQSMHFSSKLCETNCVIIDIFEVIAGYYTTDGTAIQRVDTSSEEKKITWHVIVSGTCKENLDLNSFGEWWRWEERNFVSFPGSTRNFLIFIQNRLQRYFPPERWIIYSMLCTQHHRMSNKTPISLRGTIHLKSCLGNTSS